MSQSVEKRAKKRKHASSEAAHEAEPKRMKKHKADKGKGRATDGGEEFRVVQASMVVSVAPVFANNLRAGVEEMLDSLVMRYIPALEGVMLAHADLKFLDSTAAIKADCPFANCRIAFEATVWSPQVGMKLVGKVKLCSPDHIALLVHRTFNVSIPRHHIPTDQWEFEYGPLENDPEFGGAEGAEVEGDITPEVEGGGRWIHKLTGTKLGGTDGFLELTVVGLTVVNQMLSLVGSIQLDPFSPEHVPEKVVSSHVVPPERTVVDEEPILEADGGSDDEVDTFGMLGRLGDEAVAREAEQRERDKAAGKKHKRKNADLEGATPKSSKKKRKKGDQS